MTALTAWYDDVLPDLTGLTPGNAALKFIRDGAIALCERVNVWIIDHPPIDIVALTDTYALAPGANMEVVVPTHVMVNSVSVDPANEDDLDADLGDTWRNGNLVPGPAIAYLIPDEAHIRIVPQPDAGITGGLVMKVAVKPTVSASTVDDRLYNRQSYRNAVTAWAKHCAMLSPKKPYTNPNLAAYWLGEFNRLTGVSDIRVARGRTGRPLRSTTVHGIK